jgi:hypothetical protein
MRRLPEPPDPSASVYVQPAPHGIWSNNNNFGFAIPFGPSAGNRERIVNLPEWGEPAVWTVSLGIDYSETAWPPAADQGFEVVAEVSYGTGGSTETALVDWIQGTTFSIPMNALSINAYWSVELGEAFSPTRPNDVKLRVLLARGNVATGIPPSKFAQLLDGSFAITVEDNAVASSPARIPKFARKLFVVPLTTDDYTDITTSTNFIRFFSGPDVTGSAFATGTVPLDAEAIREGILVPPFSKYVTVENVGGGGGNAEARLNFLLQL